MTKRIESIECGSCKTPFDFSTDIPKDHIFFAFCPYCGTRNKVDLTPYRKFEKYVFRGGNLDETSTQYQFSDEYNLPDKLYGIAEPEE